jgi:hypothetical protein
MVILLSKGVVESEKERKREKGGGERRKREGEKGRPTKESLLCVPY